jgi:hypothetical protein
MVKSPPIVNPDAALRSAKSDDDLDDILDLMDRVKSKRERLKKIGLKHRNSEAGASPVASPARRSHVLRPRSSLPTSPPRAAASTSATNSRQTHQRNTEKQRHSEPSSSRERFNSIQGIFKDSMATPATPTQRESQSDQVHQVFKDVMSRKDDDDDDESEDLEEGDFVDEDLNDAMDEEAKQGENERRRVWTTRILAIAILATTFSLVSVFVLGIRRAAGDTILQHETSNATDVVHNGHSNSTAPPQWFQKCFDSTEQLDAAVLAYLKNPAPDSHVAHEYGYPIGSWCVGNITSFANVFSLRGKDLQHLYEEFNEPLDGWDTSSAVSLEAMFDGAQAFNQDISMWNVSQVTGEIVFCVCVCGTI